MKMIVQLKELGSIITGNTPSKKEHLYWDSEDISFVKPDTISDDYLTLISESKEKISLAAKSKARIVPKDAILVTCIGIVGKIGIAECDVAFNQQINAIITNEKVLPKYLAYALLNSKTRLSEIANAPVVPIINKSQFSGFKIKIEDSILVQNKVVQQLDKVTAIINARKHELQTLDDLVKARFVEMFGDPTINPFKWKIVNITEVINGKVSNGFFAKRDDYSNSGNVAVLGVAYVVNRMYSQIDNLPKTNATNKEIDKFSLKYGDMLFCRSSLVAEGIGKASIVPEKTPENVLFECHVIRIPLDTEKCVPEFMQVLSTTDYFRNQIIAQSKTATMTTIGQDGILKSNIILPPMSIQKEFYRFVKEVDKSKVVVQKALDEAQLLFDSLMQQYFG